MDSFELKSPIKKVNKVYGKRSLLSSSLPRIPTISSLLSSSSDSDSDDDKEIIMNVLNKGKEKEKLMNISSRTQSTPSKLPSSSYNHGNSTLGSTAAKLLSMKAKRSLSVVQQEEEIVVLNGNSKKNVEGSLKIVVETEWDEVVDRASKSSKIIASTSKLSTTISPAKSISPIKRNRVLESTISSSSSSPVQSLEELSPKPPKRVKQDVSIISHTLPSSSASSSLTKISPTQKQQQQSKQQTIRLSSPTQSSPSRATATSTSTPRKITSPPKSPRSPVQPRSPTQPIASSSSLTSNSKAVLLSPAKDLSSLFQQFTNPVTSGNGSSNGGNDKLVVAAMSGKTKGLISGLGSRSPSKLTPPQSPSQSLKKSSSFPSISNSNSPTTSHESNSSTNLPISLSTRPLVRANTTLGLSTSLTAQPQQPASNSSSAFVPRGVGVSNKRTYGAGGGRSFKRDEEEESIFGFPTSASSSTTPAKSSSSMSMLNLKPYREKESYATLRTKWGVDYEESLDDANASQEGLAANELKSVLHLREKGENTRFGDEFNYLVEGLGASMSLGVRRASTIEVLRKMLEVEFVRRLIASGFVERLFVDFRKAEAGDGTDRVLDSALAFLIILLVKDQRIAESLLRIPITTSTSSNQVQADVLAVLTRNLNQTWANEGIVGLGASATPIKGISKGDLRSLASLRTVIDKSTFAQSGAYQITLRSLSLVAITTFASFTPRSTFRPQDLICSSGVLDSVIATFLQETDGIDLRISRYESGLDLLPSDGSMNLTSIDTCLQIFESCSSSTPQAYDILSTKLTSLTSTLTSLILASHILAHDTNPTTNTGTESMNVLLSSLRMLIDLTTNHEEWSRELMRDSNVEIVGSLVKIIVAARRRKCFALVDETETKIVLSSDDNNDEVAVDGKEKESSVMLRYDLLCLALGVLTNLVETVDTTKDILRESLIDSECKESRKCARKCQCLDRKTSIYRLTDLYLDPLDDSLNELNTSFINGYSGILLGLIMLDAPENQILVLEALSDHPKQLSNLISAMEEFANLHDQASEKRGEEIIHEEVGLEEEEENEATQIEGAEMDLDLVIESEKKVVHVAVRIRSMLESLK